MKSLYELGIEYEEHLANVNKEVEELTDKIKHERNFQERQKLQKLKMTLEDEALELKIEAETLKGYYRRD